MKDSKEANFPIHLTISYDRKSETIFGNWESLIMMKSAFYFTSKAL